MAVLKFNRSNGGGLALRPGPVNRGVLDRLIETISPRWALRRRAARLALGLNAHARKYQAASVERRATRWTTAKTSPNAELGTALNRLIARSREAIRNNPYAKRGRDVLVAAIIGTGIAPQAEDSPVHDELWEEWAESIQCDSEAYTSFYGLQALAMQAIIESGACLVRRHRLTAAEQRRMGLAIPIQVQVLEPDFIDLSQDQIISKTGNKIIQGVEIDKRGKPVAYWLFDEHPGELASISSYTSRRVPAEEIIHVFQKGRPGQVHGVPWFHSVLVRLRDFDEYEDARLIQQKIACCFAAFVHDIEMADTEEDIELPEKIEPGRVELLPNGKTISFTNPPSTEHVGEFAKTALHGIAAGMGVTYESLTTDLKDVSFTSGRMGKLDFYGQVDLMQWNMVIPQLCSGVWRWFDTAARISGRVRASVSADWTTPARPLVNPGREGAALKNDVRSGFITPSKAARKRGNNPKKHWKKFADDLAVLDSLGIVLDIDPRRIGGGGTAQADQD